MTSARPLLADVLPPPTPGLDWLYLGLPLAIVALAVIVAAALWVGRTLRRRGRGRPAAVAAGLAVFVALDLVAYLLAIGPLRPPRPSRDLPPAPGPRGQVP